MFVWKLESIDDDTCEAKLPHKSGNVGPAVTISGNTARTLVYNHHRFRAPAACGVLVHGKDVFSTELVAVCIYLGLAVVRAHCGHCCQRRGIRYDHAPSHTVPISNRVLQPKVCRTFSAAKRSCRCFALGKGAVRKIRDPIAARDCAVAAQVCCNCRACPKVPARPIVVVGVVDTVRPEHQGCPCVLEPAHQAVLIPTLRRPVDGHAYPYLARVQSNTTVCFYHHPHGCFRPAIRRFSTIHDTWGGSWSSTPQMGGGRRKGRRKAEGEVGGGRLARRLALWCSRSCPWRGTPRTCLGWS